MVSCKVVEVGGLDSAFAASGPMLLATGAWVEMSAAVVVVSAAGA